jgi:hypothetical protein
MDAHRNTPMFLPLMVKLAMGAATLFVAALPAVIH